MAHLFIGLSEINAPFWGGFLVPSPDVVVANIPVDAFGERTIGGPWPSGNPSGLSFTFQYLVVDGTALGGLSHSNAVRGTQP